MLAIIIEINNDKLFYEVSKHTMIYYFIKKMSRLSKDIYVIYKSPEILKILPNGVKYKSPDDLLPQTDYCLKVNPLNMLIKKDTLENAINKCVYQGAKIVKSYFSMGKHSEVECDAFQLYSTKVSNISEITTTKVYLSPIEILTLEDFDSYILIKSHLEYQGTKTEPAHHGHTLQRQLKLNEKLRRIKLIILDFDGCISDGRIYYDHLGNTIKSYYSQDAEAIGLASKKGYQIGILSGNDLKFFKAKEKKWGLKFMIGNCTNKIMQIKKLSHQNKIGLDKIGYFGDGLNDLISIQTAGFSACPSNADPRVKQACDYICKNHGGHGAIKEFLSLLP